VAADDVHDLAAGWPELAAAPADPVALEDLAIKTYFGPSSVVIRRPCLRRVGAFDTSLRSGEDRDMWLRLAASYPIVKLGVPLWYYRIHDGNMSHHASRMESNELRLLGRAFTTLKPLQGRWLLRRKALSYARYSAAYMYRAAGENRSALARMLQSFVLYPLPYRRREVRMSWARAKMLVWIAYLWVRAGLAGNRQTVS
jgi:hypothetical protein